MFSIYLVNISIEISLVKSYPTNDNIFHRHIFTHICIYIYIYIHIHVAIYGKTYITHMTDLSSKKTHLLLRGDRVKEVNLQQRFLEMTSGAPWIG